MKNIGVLHVITDTTVQSKYTHPQLAELVIQGSADTIQFRHKNGTTRELIQIAQQMQTVCANHDVPLIVNDRADIALAVGASGTHFGQDDMPVAIGRKFSLQKPSSVHPRVPRKRYLKQLLKAQTTSGLVPSIKHPQSRMPKHPKD